MFYANNPKIYLFSWLKQSYEPLKRTDNVESIVNSTTLSIQYKPPKVTSND